MARNQAVKRQHLRRQPDAVQAGQVPFSPAVAGFAQPDAAVAHHFQMWCLDPVQVATWSPTTCGEEAAYEERAALEIGLAPLP